MQNPTYYNSMVGADRFDLQTCVLQYRTSKNENLLRIILFQLRGTFNYYLYAKTNYPDKSELLALYEDKLLECLENFDESKNTKFITFFSRCLDNALINFINSNRNNDLSLDYEYQSDNDNVENDTLTNILAVNTSEIEDVETNLFLESIRHTLDDNEYAVCKILLTEPHRLKYREIAEEMGLTIAAIPNIFKRLRKKFKSGLFAEKFTNSL